jgi:dodecin
MVYKYIDIVGISTKGIDDAIRDAIEESSKTIKNIKWAELGRVTILVKKGVLEYQAEVNLDSRSVDRLRNN